MEIKKRKKAFLGSIIGSVVGAGLGIAGNAISSNKQARAQEQIYRENLATNNRQNVLNAAINLNNTYGDQEYVDDFNKKITTNNYYKMGGKRKARKKCLDGAEIADATNGIIGGLQNFTNSVMQGNSALRNVKYNINPYNTQSSKVGEPKGKSKVPDYINNGTYYDRMGLMYKCGGKKKYKSKRK